jgi:hypothetical protein
VLSVPLRLLPLLALVCWVAEGCAQQPAVRADPGAASPTAAPTETLWWSPLLMLASIRDIPAALASRFETPLDVTAASPTAGAPPGVMTNCESYFAFRKRGYEVQSENDSAVMKLEGARCQALMTLRTTALVSRRPPLPFAFDAKALASLPPALGPGPSPGERTRRQEATSQGLSWRAYDPKATMVALGAGSAIVTGTDWTTKLEVLARGDFTGDGTTDVLLRTVSHGTEGSWREVRLRVLSQDQGQPVLAIKSEFPL